MEKKYQWLITSPLAHRGLAQKGYVENTAPAFKNCVKKGIGIEVDLRLLKDGSVICFHDDTPFSFCDCNLKFCDMTTKEVKSLKLYGKHKIVFLADFLKIIDGLVPVLFEIKSPFKISDDFVKQIKNYKGVYAFESFNPITVFLLKKKFDCPVGQLVSGNTEAPKSDEFKWKIVNAVTKPDFIAHKIDTLSQPYGLLPFILWTVDTPEKLEKAKKFKCNYIFEATKDFSLDDG